MDIRTILSSAHHFQKNTKNVSLTAVGNGYDIELEWWQLMNHFSTLPELAGAQYKTFDLLNQSLDDSEKLTKADYFKTRAKLLDEVLESMEECERVPLAQMLDEFPKLGEDACKVTLTIPLETARSMLINLDGKMLRLQQRYSKIRASTRLVKDLPPPAILSLAALVDDGPADGEKNINERLAQVDRTCGAILMNIAKKEDDPILLDLLEPLLDSSGFRSRTQAYRLNLSLFFSAISSLGPEAESEAVESWTQISCFLDGKMQQQSPHRFLGMLQFYEHVGKRMGDIQADAESMRVRRKDPVSDKSSCHEKLVYEKIILDHSLNARFEIANEKLSEAYKHSKDRRLEKIDLFDPILDTHELKSTDYTAKLYARSVEALSTSERNRLGGIAATMRKASSSKPLSDDIREEVIDLHAKLDAKYHEISSQCELEHARLREKGKKKIQSRTPATREPFPRRTARKRVLQQGKLPNVVQNRGRGIIENQSPAQIESELSSILHQLSALQDDLSEDKSSSNHRKHQRAMARLPQHLREDYQANDAAVDFRDFVLGKKMPVEKTAAMLRLYRPLLEQKQRTWKSTAGCKETDDLPLTEAEVARDVEALHQAFKDL